MSTDTPYTAPATLAAASETAHCAYDFAQVDVFAEAPLEGNALAIFADARGLSPGEMQALARETNLSETTFILPRAPEIERERGVQVRIFLTTGEVPLRGTSYTRHCKLAVLEPPSPSRRGADHTRPRHRPHSRALHTAAARRTRRLWHHEAERPNLR